MSERYSTDYGSTDAEADSRSPSPNSSKSTGGSGGGGGGGGGGGLSGSGSAGSVAVGPTGIAGAANGLIAKAAYTVTAVAGSGAANASGPGELLGAWWGAAKRAVGVGDAATESLDRDLEFDRLSARRMAYNEKVGDLHGPSLTFIVAVLARAHPLALARARALARAFARAFTLALNLNLNHHPDRPSL